MSTKAFSEMSAEELNALLVDRNRVVIMWRCSDGKEVRILSGNFSRSVAQVFSSHCVRLLAFPGLRVTPNGKTAIYITGGSFPHLSQVFQAMVDYCKGNKAIPSFGDQPFLNSAKLVGAAKHLEMSALEQKIKSNIENLRKTIPSAVDTEAVIKAYDSHHPARIGVVNSLAAAVVEGRLDEHKEQLKTLRANDAGFDRALAKEIAFKRGKMEEARAREEAKKARKEAAFEREWPALGK